MTGYTTTNRIDSVMIEIADAFKGVMALGMLLLGGLVNWWFSQLSKRNERSIETQEETKKAINELILKVTQIEMGQLKEGKVKEIVKEMVESRIEPLRKELATVSKYIIDAKALEDKVQHMEASIKELTFKFDHYLSNHGRNN